MKAPAVEKSDTFVEPQVLLQVLKKGSRFLFESTLIHEKNRWAILGDSAVSVFKAQNGKCLLNGEEISEGNPFVVLSDLIAKEPHFERSSFPFLGGWLGCVSYEASRFLEKVPTHEDELGFDLAFYLVDSFYLFDLVERVLYFVSSSGRIDELRGAFAPVIGRKMMDSSSVILSEVKDRSLSSSYLDLSTEEAYIEAIHKIKSYIREGHSYQVNLSQRFCFENSVEPFDIYKALSQISPVPFAGFFEWENITILSGSPERLFEVDGQSITTRPIAGTRRYGTEEETLRFIQELKNDPKEHAEHSMLVDLSRNDLGRICEYGSVFVKQYMDIVSYKTVIHTESDIQGTLLEKTSFLDIMRAVFPGGSITGVPKIRTMEIIHELEPCSRGIYTGSFGYWSKCGHADFNIMIRPILCKQGKAYTHAGGGITWKADPKREYKESLNKARSQIQAILEAQ